MSDMQFDYVVVGAGSAGSVIASRLTEDPKISVCLLEAGGPDKSVLVHAPAGVVAMLPTKINNYAYSTVPQKGLNGRRAYMPRGKTLGGSSSINGMVYIRGHKWDYDNWAAMGAKGWSYDEVLPYFKRAENNEVISDEFHGKGGPLNVTGLRSPNPMHEVFLEAASHLQIPVNKDFNGAEQYGVGRYQVTHKNGERCSAAKGYLTPNLNRPNLTVLTKAQTRKVVFEGKRAVGVEFKQGGKVKVVRAGQEVILSGGAFGSPQVLMLSGIGAAAELKAHGINVVVDLPAVGKNLQDHPDAVHTYRTKSNTETLGVSLRGIGTILGGISQYRKKRSGVLTSNFVESGAFLRSSPDQEIPDLQMHFVHAIVDDHARKTHLGHGISSHICILRPKSRGVVELASADPSASLNIDPRFYEEEEDMELMVKACRLQLQILNAAPFDKYRGKLLYPVDINDDESIRQDIRNRADTAYHPAGTCRMGQADDPQTVVDSRLRVKCVEGLRVADASVMPSLIGGNTNAPSVMIGEKASDMILEDRNR